VQQWVGLINEIINVNSGFGVKI